MFWFARLLNQSLYDWTLNSPSRLLGLASKCDLLTEETEMGIVAEKSQHDKVGVKAIETVTRVGVVVGLSFARANEFLDLVLALSGNVMAAENDLDVAPLGIFRDALAHIVFQMV